VTRSSGHYDSCQDYSILCEKHLKFRRSKPLKRGDSSNHIGPGLSPQELIVHPRQSVDRHRDKTEPWVDLKDNRPAKAPSPQPLRHPPRITSLLHFPLRCRSWWLLPGGLPDQKGWYHQNHRNKHESPHLHCVDWKNKQLIVPADGLCEATEAIQPEAMTISQSQPEAQSA
jgi:hypothetical protein